MELTTKKLTPLSLNWDRGPSLLIYPDKNVNNHDNIQYPIIHSRPLGGKLRQNIPHMSRYMDGLITYRISYAY